MKKKNLTRTLLEALNEGAVTDFIPGEPCWFGDKQVIFQSVNDDETTARVLDGDNEIEVPLSELSESASFEVGNEVKYGDEEGWKITDIDGDDVTIEKDGETKTVKMTEISEDGWAVGDAVKCGEDTGWVITDIDDDKVTIEKDGESKTVSADDICEADGNFEIGDTVKVGDDEGWIVTDIDGDKVTVSKDGESKEVQMSEISEEEDDDEPEFEKGDTVNHEDETWVVIKATDDEVTIKKDGETKTVSTDEVTECKKRK